MKVVILAPANSIHTIRWVNEMANRRFEVTLISMHKPHKLISTEVKMIFLSIKAPFGYLLNYIYVKSALKLIQPDLLHVHYASGYGTLARLVGFHPYILSVWGSDVFDFPHKSRFHYKTTVKNLRYADKICSTSNVMSKKVLDLTPLKSSISVTPFGVDVRAFNEEPKKYEKNKIIIGTVKHLSSEYGIDILIRSFHRAINLISQEDTELADNMQLMIVGEGKQRYKLEELCKDLGILSAVEFVGQVSHEKVPEYFRTLDIFVAPSRNESFGVAVIEASSCGIPVIVSDAGGLPEVVIDGVTGLIVKKEDVASCADAILRLVKDKDLRSELGHHGREYVLKNYNWNDCADRMEKLYYEVIGHRNRNMLEVIE